jgi:hypothetical protein
VNIREISHPERRVMKITITAGEAMIKEANDRAFQKDPEAPR